MRLTAETDEAEAVAELWRLADDAAARRTLGELARAAANARLRPASPAAALRGIGLQVEPRYGLGEGGGL